MSAERDVSALIGETAVGLGARVVFGLVGSGNLALANALRSAGASYLGVCHESAAVASADGFARVCAATGVATVHQGPGLTNTLTALVEAVKARTPLVLLAAETAPERASNQALDQVAVAESLGAIALRLESAASAVQQTTEAFDRARIERLPVVLNLPIDVLGAPADAAFAPPRRREPALSRAPEAAATGDLATRVEAARLAVILAGRGALRGGAKRALEELAEQAGALLATTAAAHGLFAGNPRAIGIAGGFASPLAKRLIGAADLVIVFGSSLNHWTTDHGELFAHATIVQIDTERGASGAHEHIAADAELTAQAVTQELQRRGFRGSGAAGELSEIAAYRRRDEIDDRSTGEVIDPRTLMTLLDDTLPAERTVAIDSGHFMGWPAMYLGVAAPDRFVMTQAFQSVGLGLASAIGAAAARPQRVTLAVIGDGGARMSLMELDTAVRLALPLVIAVVNDCGYGAEVHDFAPLGVDVSLAQLTDVDFATVARGLGAQGATVRRAEDLAVLTQWLEKRSGPLLLDCKVNPEVAGSW